jgi:Flp pilus assembly protein TadG
MLRANAIKRRPRRGAAAAELAILAPILFFMFAIAVDYARIFYFTQTLRSAARNGAYFASDYPGLYSYTNAQQVATADLSDLNPAPTFQMYYSSSPDGPFTSPTPSATGTNYVQVQVSWTFNSITNFPLVPSQRTLVGTEIMRVAQIEPTFPVTGP